MDQSSRCAVCILAHLSICPPNKAHACIWLPPHPAPYYSLVLATYYVLALSIKLQGQNQTIGIMG